MNAKLKPCPFCGDEISIYKHEWPYSGYGLSHHNQDCLLSVLINRAFDVRCNNKTTLIKAWNKRVQ